MTIYGYLDYLLAGMLVSAPVIIFVGVAGYIWWHTDDWPE